VGVATDYEAELLVSDFKRIVRELNKMDDDLVKEMRRGIRQIAEPVRAGIRAAIPSRAPISGMVRKLSPVGKTWNTGRRARTVKIEVSSPKRGLDKDQALVTLVVPSPATIIADMAKNFGRRDGAMTDWYVYPRSKTTTENSRPGERRHRISGQGRAMVQALGVSPQNRSRYVYPGAEKRVPEAREKFANLMFDAAERIEKNING